MLWLIAYALTILGANWAIQTFGVVPVGFGLAAFVAQDGFDPDAVDWSAFDVLFVGGRPLVDRKTTPQTEWKRAEGGGYAAISEAKRRGKRVHVGRVNGEAFLRNVVAAGADSADGTGLAAAPDALWPRVTGWLDRLATCPPMPLEAV